jgi:hypothetical protein
MRKSIISVLGILVLIAASSMSCYARGYGHGYGHGYGYGNHVRFSSGIWVGPGWGAVWPGAFYPPYYPYYPYSAPRVVVQPRYEEYAAPAPEPQEQDYWYYCSKPEGYYPYITTCPGGWMKVVPPPETPAGEE